MEDDIMARSLQTKLNALTEKKIYRLLSFRKNLAHYLKGMDQNSRKR